VMGIRWWRIGQLRRPAYHRTFRVGTQGVPLPDRKISPGTPTHPRLVNCVNMTVPESCRSCATITEVSFNTPVDPLESRRLMTHAEFQRTNG